MTSGGASVPDSAPIQRWKLGSFSTVVLAFVALQPTERRVEQHGAGTWAFATEDQWVVGQDGWIAILRVDPYLVDFYSPSGTRVRGPPVAGSRIAVSDAHRREWLAEQARPAPVIVTTPGGR